MSIRDLPEDSKLVTTSSKLATYKATPTACPFTRNKHSEKENRQSSVTTASKTNKMLRDKPEQRNIGLSLVVGAHALKPSTQEKEEGGSQS